MARTRPAVLSGTWYPSDPAELAAQIDGFLAAAEPAQHPAGRPLIALVPHAGYMYSGPTAGRLYGLLGDLAPHRIFILAPNHRVALHRIALSSAGAFATPLGDVAVDLAATARLTEHPLFSIDDQAHAQEHAVEIQLPLLQRTWPADLPEIIPMLVPQLDGAAGREVARALTAEMQPNDLLLVSTDFTHYGAAFGYVPFGQEIPESLEKLDAGAILKVLAGDAEGLRQYGRETGITMCGLQAAAVALDCGLPEGYEGALLHYSRSGDRDNDYTQSVSYAAVLLCSGPNPSQEAP
jgi:AmmeMemoRadiSam system protein B